MDEKIKKIVRYSQMLFEISCIIILLLVVYYMFLENKKLKEIIDNKNLIINSYKISDIELDRYVSDILYAYNSRNWSNVIVLSSNYQNMLEYRKEDIRPVIYLSTGYAYYSLYRNNKSNEYFTNALINIDNYTNVIITNSVAFYTKGLIYLEHGDQNTNDFDIAIDSYNQSDKNFKKARSIEYKEQYDRHIKIVATRIKKLNEMHKTNK